MIAALFLTVGCIDIPAMNGLVDRIVPEETKTYRIFDVWDTEGNFAPDPAQDQDTYINAIEDLISNPLKFQETAQNISWKEDQHTFFIENNWDSTFIILLLSVDYSLGGGIDPSEGPAGTLDFTVTDPDGMKHVYGKDSDGYEIVTWNNQLEERPLLLPVIGGTWTITISGSGLDGIGSILYSGDYNIRIESDKLE
jgi:hypothetical protein|tara:strand:- start:17 stop:604 length:588 start_codon:yes stop_codon:yes gene_type:complete